MKCPEARVISGFFHLSKSQKGKRIGPNTVSNPEVGRNVGFEGVVRVAVMLGQARDPEVLFPLKN